MMKRCHTPTISNARQLKLVRALLCAAGVIAAGSAIAADIPKAVVAEGKTTVLTVRGEGVQIYECKADPAGGAKWQFREPIATLIKDGKTIGRHFAGPTWLLASGSAVVGKVDAQAPGGSTKDVALLRLNVIDKRGGGELSGVTTIQRLDTIGGAFSGTCDKPGGLHLEPYSAEYVFLGN